MAEGLNFSSLDPIKQQAQSASSDAANLAGNVPNLLNQLKTNLTTIFAKDNPLIAERGNLLERFLNTPSTSRVSTLPSNLPVVEGSNLNLSPTQQDAIATARYNAALVPLMGLNNVITGIYGNIPGMVQNAGNIYDAQVRAKTLQAQILRQQYEDSLNQILEQEKVRQFNDTLAENRRQFDVGQKNKSGSGLGSLSWGNESNASFGADASSFDLGPDSSTAVYGPPDPRTGQIGGMTPPSSWIQPSTPLTPTKSFASSIGDWFNRTFRTPTQAPPPSNLNYLMTNPGALKLGGF